MKISYVDDVTNTFGEEDAALLYDCSIISDSAL